MFKFKTQKFKTQKIELEFTRSTRKFQFNFSRLNLILTPNRDYCFIHYLQIDKNKKIYNLKKQIKINFKH